MKTAFKNICRTAAATVVLATAFAGCQDDFDAPSMVVPEASVKPNTSIITLKTDYWDDEANYIDTVGVTATGEHVIIAGRVISSDQAGNIYKSLVIQDATGALAISIDRSSLYNEYRVGQEVVIDVTDMYLGKYSSLQQLGYPDYSGGYGWQATFMPFELFKSHSQLNGLPEPARIDTVTTTIAALSTTAEGLRSMQSQLVRFNNVHFAEGGKAQFCSAHKVNTNRDLVDENGNTIIVRTSGYATFWSQTLPEGAGDVVGILSYNGSGSSAKWQLLLRSTDDLMNFGNPTLPVGTETNPYTVEEAVAIEQKATTSTAAWVKGYIVGAVKAEITEVKSADDIEWTAPAEMNNTLVIGNAPDSRSLDKCVVIALPQGSSLRQYGNLRDNPDNLGRAIRVYGTLERYMSTYGVTGNRGSANEYSIEGLEVPGNGIPTGNGTEASPYNPAQVVAKGTAATESSVWLKGYIVGWVDNASQNYADENNTHFSTPATVATNVLVATTPDVTDYKQCVAVNLPNANNIRARINLVDNPSNLGKAVTFKGNIIKYFNIPGLKEVTEATLDGGSGETPVTPANPVAQLDVNFEGVTSVGQLPGWSVVTPQGDKSWFFRSYDNNSFAEMTAYNGKAGTDGFDSWLITPALDVAAMTDKVLSFESCVGYTGNGTLEVYAMTSADPTKATLTRLSATIPAPTGSWGSFTPSGEISLAGFSGTIWIGFRYKAAAGSNYTTYRVDNVLAGKKAQGGSSEPSEPVTPPSEGAGTAASPYTVAEVIALKPTSTSVIKEGVWATGYIVGFVDTGKASSASADNTVFGTTGAVASNLLIAATPDCKDLSKCVSVQLASGGDVRKALNLKDNPGMLGKQVSIKGNVRLYVGIPGIHSPSAYALGDKGKE